MANPKKTSKTNSKEIGLEIFKSFLERLQGYEPYTSYSNQEIHPTKNEILFTADGEDTELKDAWTVHVVWKRSSNNLFYYREYKDGYQADKFAVRAKGDANLAPLFTRLLRAIKKY